MRLNSTPAARALIGAVVLFVVASPSIAAGQEQGTERGTAVDGAIQVTTDLAARGHVAPTLAVHPDDPRIVAVAESDAYSGDCSIRVSQTGGLGWTTVTQPDVPEDWPNCAFVPFGPVVDVEFGPDGALFYAFSGYNSTETQGRIFLARSDDLGVTWDTTMVPSIARDLEVGEAGLNASPSIAVDPNNPDNVHVGWGSNWATYTLSSDALDEKLYYWDVIERVYVTSSSDGGLTFGDPVDVGEGLRLTEDKEGMKPPPHVVVGNDGEVFVFFGEYSRGGTRDDSDGDAPPAHLYVAVSRDGGESYTNEAVYEQKPPTDGSGWIWVPRGGIDRTSGTLYVVWENMSHAGDPVQISLIRSTDGGETWSDPTQVNDVVPEREWNYPEAYPELSVAPNGRIDVAWYDWRNDIAYDPEEDENVYQDVYYTYSTDQGTTWADNVRVTDRAIDRRIGPWAAGGIRGTLGLAATDDGAYVAWSDTRNGNEMDQAQDIYFSRVRFDDAGPYFSTDDVEPASLAWGLTGAAAALVGAGLILLVVMGRSRRRAPSGG